MDQLTPLNDRIPSAMSSLSAKLAALSATLRPDEQALIATVVRSAADHLSKVQGLNEGDRLVNSKPMSTIVTAPIRNEILEMARTLS